MQPRFCCIQKQYRDPLRFAYVLGLLGPLHACWTGSNGKFGSASCKDSIFVVSFPDTSKLQGSQDYDKVLATCQADASECDQQLKETILPKLMQLTSSEHEDARAEVRRIDHVVLAV
eukprot:m.57680 g.57680  ORF g.57680 m.57680 type:complete len:117 (-) comp13740_c0_seq4:44-394(-)